MGMCFGFDIIPVTNATGSYDSAFHKKAEAICDCMINRYYNFGFLHIKGVDDAGHDRNINYKVITKC